MSGMAAEKDDGKIYMVRPRSPLITISIVEEKTGRYVHNRGCF
jgi:hypothetical protein